MCCSSQRLCLPTLLCQTGTRYSAPKQPYGKCLSRRSLWKLKKSVPFRNSRVIALASFFSELTCTAWHKNTAPNFQMKKVFLTVNQHDILHASTCTLYAYIYKVKNLPQMATLTYSHFGNPGGSYHRAHYSLFLPSIGGGGGGHYYSILRDYSARECRFSRPRRSAAGRRVLAAAGFLF